MAIKKGLHNALYTMPGYEPFLPALAEGVWDRYGNNPEKLRQVHIFLPTRRACREFSDELLKAAKREAILLPRISPLGDIDDENDVLAVQHEDDLPPAIHPRHRQLLLADIIMAHNEGYDKSQALMLAKDLGLLIDELHINNVPFSQFHHLVPSELSQHWQLTLTFLEKIFDAWAQTMKDKNLLDPAKHRFEAIKKMTDAWQVNPPSHPIIVAGSTGSQPATALFLRSVLGLEQGCVVLPGLDTEMPPSQWDLIDENHPQFHMKLLLEFAGIARSSVHLWPYGSSSRADRTAFIRNALCPEAATDEWRTLANIKPSALSDISLITCRDAYEEAQAIAVIIRSRVEAKDKKIAVVTPDRNLGIKVRAALRRWDMKVDDTAGIPFFHTRVGRYLLLLVTMIESNFHVLDVMAFLKSALTGLGLDKQDLQQRILNIDMHLRGPRPPSGLGGIRSVINQEYEGAAEMIDVLDRLQQCIGQKSGPETLHARWSFYKQAIENIARDDTKSLLDESDKRALSDMHDAVLAMPDLALSMEDSHTQFFQIVFSDLIVRPITPLEQTVHIWGVLEARLLSADTIILGGLNEGSWPIKPDINPWLNRLMRKDLGLLMPERRIGQMAHDFVSCFAAPRIYLTRAEKVSGTQTIPARWLQRMEALLTMKGDPQWLQDKESIVEMARSFHFVDQVTPCAQPKPRPSVKVRPTTLSVSDIGLFMSDPYSFYAKKILKLQPLSPLDEDPDRADYGDIVHGVLCAAVKEGIIDRGDFDALQQLTERFLVKIKQTRPGHYYLWRQKMINAMRDIFNDEIKHQSIIQERFAEITAEMPFEGASRHYTLRARADRIDVLSDGRARLIDYKTGALPSLYDMKCGLKPQMPIEALMIENNHFPGIKAEGLEVGFWKISGRQNGSYQSMITDKNIRELIELATKGLKKVLALMDDSDTLFYASPQSEDSASYNDYLHLARTKEWMGGA